MRLYPDEERYEVSGDLELFSERRQALWKWTSFLIQRASPTLAQPELYWYFGVDRVTGQRVWVEPRGPSFTWADAIDREAFARRVQALALPNLVPVLRVGPGIVFAEPPSAGPWPSLSIEAAAACALEAAEVVARLHEKGCGKLHFGPSHLRLVEEGGVFRVRWLLPGVPCLDLLEALLAAEDHLKEREHPRWQWRIDPLEHDLWQLSFFFFSLTAQATPGDLAPDQSEALGILTRLRDEGPKPAGLHDAASLARLFAVIAGRPEPKILPIVRVLPRVFPDWDDVIADGEGLLASETHYLDSIKLPLATAYHQRASRSWARGERGSALADVERAIELDPHPPYHTTRAVLLDALDRRAEAREAVATALELHANPPRKEIRWQEEDPGVDKHELARAHVTRGLIALREGALDQAEADVRRAQEIYSTPLSVRAMAAIERARRSGS